MRRLVVGLFLATFAHIGVSLAQSNYSGQTIKWDNYTFKFLPGGQMAQVLGADGKVVGTLLMMNGELQAVPLPGPDVDKRKKSFEDRTARNNKLPRPMKPPRLPISSCSVT